MNDRPQRNQVTAIVRGAMGRALEWRLLTLFTATVLSTTAVSAFPAWRVLAGALDRSPRAKEIAQSFDLLAFADIGVAFFRSAAPVTGAMIVGTLLYTWARLRPRPEVARNPASRLSSNQ